MPPIDMSIFRRVALMPPPRPTVPNWASPPQIAAIVTVSIVSTLLLCTILYTTIRLLRAYLAAKASADSESSHTEKTADPVELYPRKESGVNWARKDSNVLWSVYINDKDLATQFPGRKWSRMFSVGSGVTTDTNKCPLDRSSMESVRLPDPPRVDSKKQGPSSSRVSCVVGVEKESLGTN